MKKVVNKPTSAPPKGLAPAPPKTSQSNNRNAAHPSNIEQNRSLTIDRCRTDVSSIFLFHQIQEFLLKHFCFYSIVLKRIDDYRQS